MINVQFFFITILIKILKVLTISNKCLLNQSSKEEEEEDTRVWETSESKGVCLARKLHTYTQTQCMCV